MPTSLTARQCTPLLAAQPPLNRTLQLIATRFDHVHDLAAIVVMDSRSIGSQCEAVHISAAKKVNDFAW